MTDAALLERVGVLRRERTEEKRAIHEHRRRLQYVAAELAELEAHAKRLGLELRIQPTGVGGTHGRPEHTKTET